MRLLIPILLAASLSGGADDPPRSEAGAPVRASGRCPARARSSSSGSPGTGRSRRSSTRGPAAPVRSAGPLPQAMIHGGRFLQSDFVFGRGGRRTTTGTGTIGFEPETRASSPASGPTPGRPGCRSAGAARSFDGEQVVLHGLPLDPDAGDRSPLEDRLAARRRGPDADPPAVRDRPRRGRAAGDGADHDPEAGERAGRPLTGSARIRCVAADRPRRRWTVPRARQSPLTVDLTKRTLPSASRALTPPGW